MVALLLGAMVALLPTVDLSVETRLVCGVGLACVVMIGPVLRFGRRPLREPITYYAALSVLFLAVSALFWLGNPPDNPATLARSDIVAGLGVTIVAFLALWVGYFTLRPRLARRSASDDGTPVRLPGRRVVLALAAVGILSRVIQLATDTYGYQSAINADIVVNGDVPHAAYLGFVTFSGIGLEAAILLAAVRVWAGPAGSAPRGDVVLVWLLLAVNVGFGLLSGFKGGFVVGAILLLLCYGKYRQHLPWKALLAAAVLVVGSVPFNLQFRSLAQDTPESGSLSLASQAFDQTISGESAWGESIANWAPTRLRQIDSIAVVVRDTPTLYPKLNGRDLLISPAVILIPRALWPDKPVLSTGFDFARQYFNQRASNISATGVTQIGDLFRNFGMPGVALGMFLLGLVFAGLGHVVERSQPAGLLLAGVVTTVLVGVESDWITIFAILVRLVLLVGLVALVARVGARPRLQS